MRADYSDRGRLQLPLAAASPTTPNARVPRIQASKHPAARDTLIAAFLASIYAVASALLTNANPYWPLVAAIIALAGYFGVNHVADEHRRQIAAYYEQVWARRRREAGL